MKNHRRLFALLGLAAACASPLLHAQGSAPAVHSGNAATLSASASGQAVGASGELATASAKTASAVAAVPVWAGASAVAATGASIAVVGASTAQTGGAIGRGAQTLWDFGSGDPACRPALNQQRSVPPAKATTPIARKDPPPSEALRAVR